MENNFCVVCKKTFFGYGCNPSPISDKGVCCEMCDNTYVLDARLKLMFPKN